MTETERNMRGEHLVVQSLEVLENFTGGAARAIDAKIGSVQETVVSVASRADKFYQDAAADGIITPEEKKTLKRDFVALRRTYLAILQQAEIKGLSDDPRITGLTTVYNALYTYLYSTIKVFDDMESNTVITSSDDMNAYYDAYYDAQMFAQAVLTETALALVRVLSSLSDPGRSDELGYYGGQLYRYVADEGWQAVSSGDYMGVVTGAASLTETKEGSFFLAGASFAVALYRITADAGVIATDGGDHIAVSVRAVKGDVWACSGGIWRRVPDRNDWRYVLATNDLVALGFPISPSLEGEIRSVAQDAALELTPGTYLGPRTADPVSPALGEYYLYIGNTTLTRKNGAIYKYMRTTGGTAAWTELSSEDPANYQNYMAALSDMLTEDEQSLDTGRFSVVFARTLASMSAMIETLMTQTLIIKTGGMIKSEGFDAGTGNHGFKVQADGTTIIKSPYFKLSADGTIEATNGKFSGIIAAITGNLMNINISGNSTFEGDIVSGPITISDDAPPASTLTITPDMTAEQIYQAMNTTFGAVYADVNSNLSYANNYQNCQRFSVNKAYQEQGYYLYTIICITTDQVNHQLYRDRNGVANITAYLTKFVSTNKTLRINNLPTTRPTSSGYLWNDNGTVKIS